MEKHTETIAFEEWVRRVFAHEVIDHKWWVNQDTDWNELPPSISLEYLTRLFEQSRQLLRIYTDAQVDQGLWFIIGCSSDHAHALESLEVDWDIRLRCVRSIMRLFEMFEARCSSHLSHLDEPGANPLNSICYMFWDILPTWGKPDEPACADLDKSLLKVMTDILALQSDACRESALHGLGHWQASYPKDVEQIVDYFMVKNPTMRPELRLYAERSRVGCVL